MVPQFIRSAALAGLTAVVMVIQVPGAVAISEADVNAIAKQVTVRLVNGEILGSGVLVRRQGNRYTILTAAHVLAETDNHEVITEDGQRYPLVPGSLQKHATTDLAIATFIGNRNYPVAQIGDSRTVKEGSVSYIAGFPARTSALTASIYNFTKGQITANAAQPFQDGYTLVYTNTTCQG